MLHQLWAILVPTLVLVLKMETVTLMLSKAPNGSWKTGSSLIPTDSIQCPLFTSEGIIVS